MVFELYSPIECLFKSAISLLNWASEMISLICDKHASISASIVVCEPKYLLLKIILFCQLGHVITTVAEYDKYLRSLNNQSISAVVFT